MNDVDVAIAVAEEGAVVVRRCLAICEAAGYTITDLRGDPWGSGATGLIAAADSETHATLLSPSCGSTWSDSMPEDGSSCLCARSLVCRILQHRSVTAMITATGDSKTTMVGLLLPAPRYGY